MPRSTFQAPVFTTMPAAYTEKICPSNLFPMGTKSAPEGFVAFGVEDAVWRFWPKLLGKYFISIPTPPTTEGFARLT